MTTFTLYKKELFSFQRSSKWIWLPIVFAILGVLQPLTIYYMPEILKATGGLPDGTIIEMPVPTGDEVLAGVLSQYNTVGIVIIVAAMMGIISAERHRGTMSLIMSRPVSAGQFIISKWAAEISILFISLLFGFGLSAYYTEVLFADLNFINAIKSFSIYFIWVCFIITITLLCSTLLKSNGAIMGVSIVVIAALSLLDGLAEKFMRWSPSVLATEAAQILTEQAFSSYLLFTLISSLIIIMALLLVSIILFHKQEHY